MIDTTITLIGRKRVQDQKGIYRDGDETAREILARMDSVDRREFFAGGQVGLRPELRFLVFHAEYRGEEELIYDGQHYAVYRTFSKPGSDDLELYAQRKAGLQSG